MVRTDHPAMTKFLMPALVVTRGDVWRECIEIVQQ